MACPKTSSIHSLASSSVKPLHALGGGTRQIFNVQNSNKLNFADVFLQRKLSQWKTIPGDEPIMYVNSQTLRQESVKKHFCQCGFHKKTGKYSQAVAHLA